MRVIDTPDAVESPGPLLIQKGDDPRMTVQASQTGGADANVLTPPTSKHVKMNVPSPGDQQVQDGPVSFVDARAAGFVGEENFVS